MSMSYNASAIDFYIFTDNKKDINTVNNFLKNNSIKNIFIHYTTIRQFEDLISYKFGLDSYSLPSIRKVCDWKTAYGFLFDDISKQYEFWGHNDLDIIFGRIHLPLSDTSYTNKFDVISGDRRRLCGPMSIFRYKEDFTLHSDWQNLLLNNDHVAFDEIGLDEAIKSSSRRICFGTYHNSNSAMIYQNYGSPHHGEPRRLPAIWLCGKVVSVVGQRESLFIHLGNKHNIKKLDFKKDDFLISENGFVTV